MLSQNTQSSSPAAVLDPSKIEHASSMLDKLDPKTREVLKTIHTLNSQNAGAYSAAEIAAAFTTPGITSKNIGAVAVKLMALGLVTRHYSKVSRSDMTTYYCLTDLGLALVKQGSAAAAPAANPLDTPMNPASAA